MDQRALLRQAAGDQFRRIVKSPMGDYCPTRKTRTGLVRRSAHGPDVIEIHVARVFGRRAAMVGYTNIVFLHYSYHQRVQSNNFHPPVTASIDSE